MSSPLAHLGLTNPVFAAPMAGGPTAPALVAAAMRAGSLGFLAGGYLEAAALADRIQQVRARTEVFGVNLFAPNPVPVDPEAFRRYAALIQPAAQPYGLDLDSAGPVEDDDFWADKLELLRTHPVPVVSFTFGIPDEATIAALRKAGTVTIQTVTAPAEARLAQDAGVDLLVVQAYGAGGHSGTLTPERLPARVPLTDLVRSVRDVTTLPVVAAGGIATAAEVAAVIHEGAEAVMVGTLLLLADESGASAVHRAAIADPSRGDTVLSRAFTGRPAGALPNGFIKTYESAAPTGYPALHHLTSALRKAAAAAGDPERVNLWAGTGYRNATAEPAQEILTRLAAAI